MLGTAGDSNLGGNDMDAALADWLMEQSGVTDRQVGACAPPATRSGAGKTCVRWLTLPVLWVLGVPACATPVCCAQALPAPWRERMQWALAAAEAAKVQLSSQEEAAIPLPNGGSVTLTQQAFEQVTAPLFKRMAAPLEVLGQQLFVEWATEPAEAVPGRQALHGTSSAPERQQSASSSGAQGSAPSSSSSNGITPAPQQQGRQAGDKWAPPPRRITRVVLVGQSTRLPAVQQFVERLTGVQPEMGVDPAEAVALGAAIQVRVSRAGWRLCSAVLSICVCRGPCGACRAWQSCTCQKLAARSFCSASTGHQHRIIVDGLVAGAGQPC